MLALSKMRSYAYHCNMSLNDLATLTAALGFTERNDPFTLFAEWMEDAKKSEINDPDAMSLATVDDEGLPNVRMVLLKDFDDKGFVFYTNFESQKGHEILSAGKAAAVSDGTGDGCGSGCLFQIPPARLPHWRLGVTAITSFDSTV
jgi:hypothetical protein